MKYQIIRLLENGTVVPLGWFSTFENALVSAQAWDEILHLEHNEYIMIRKRNPNDSWNVVYVG